MANRSKPPIGPLVAVGVLTLVLCLGVIYIYVGWEPFMGKPGFAMTRAGVVGMALGLLAALLLGIGLAILIIHGRHKR
jgi:hypothetical protein